MKHLFRRLGGGLTLGLLWLASLPAQAQDTRILGFADVTSTLNPATGRVSFGLGEQDLFITSDLTDRISFLGETVFRYDAAASTKFAVSVERIVFKYNYAGNHSVVVGKVHTPFNYWNDTYHHGRVFFPTIFRPAVFNEGLLPLHTLGAGLQGQNLGSLRFGYDVMVGNGLGAFDATDNDQAKSVTVAVHVKPVDGMRIGISSYSDRLAAGVTGHQHGSTGTAVAHSVRQQIFTGSFVWFRPKVEVLIESSYFTNSSDTASAHTMGSYAYVGYRLLPKVVVYGRYDLIQHQRATEERYFSTDDLQNIVGGVRYEFSYLTVAKLEFQHDERRPMLTGRLFNDMITAQFAVGF